MPKDNAAIAPEGPGDEDAIRAVVTEAFGGSAEADLVDALRADGDLALSLVARADGRVIGHVAISPMTGGFCALAPVAVDAAWRSRGIGAALVRAAIAGAAEAGFAGLFILGDPDYYARFGLSAAAAAPFSSPYEGPYFLALALRPEGLAGGGQVAHAPAFSSLG
ncbi:N-acetyltransferase [Acuticoccus sp. MNP-M23]|uniref:GNAT family N-acetyltransferase n=1 Tax=Acuticoccus sp. MNP-M23 TaxID=3072793 RepID=UPI002815094E|nr:N-acetyltransferase [Acuticoccus sp. MNP-M23]WMS45098.1 N-acetyltransferase [Acuticoccus sp. MNP-M23]